MHPIGHGSQRTAGTEPVSAQIQLETWLSIPGTARWALRFYRPGHLFPAFGTGLRQGIIREHIVGQRSEPSQCVPTFDYASVRQRVADGLTQFPGTPESSIIPVPGITNDFENDLAITGQATRLDIPEGQHESVKVKVAIQHERAIIILTERMLDKTATLKTVLL